MLRLTQVSGLGISQVRLDFSAGWLKSSFCFLSVFFFSNHSKKIGSALPALHFCEAAACYLFGLTPADTPLSAADGSGGKPNALLRAWGIYKRSGKECQGKHHTLIKICGIFLSRRFRLMTFCRNRWK